MTNSTSPNDRRNHEQAPTHPNVRANHNPGALRQTPAGSNSHNHQLATITCVPNATQYSRSNAVYSHAAQKRLSRGKKIAIGVIAAVLVVALGASAAFAVYMKAVNDKLQQGTKTKEEIDAIGDVLRPMSSFNEPFYMLLIGSDMREDSDEMGARSDTNIVVRVDPTCNQATMISIPRDTKIEIEGYGTNKFNAAYNFNGTAGVISEANKLLDIEIACYAEVNFSKLVDLVDAVGGVDIEVDEYIDDPDADRPESGQHIVIQEGLQHLDGEAALVFARSRAYADGDFTRTANQRKLIEAIVYKVLEAPLTSLPGIIESAADCVTTNLSVENIVGLAQQFKSDGDLVIYSAMLPSWTQTINEISYVINDAEATREMMEIVEAGGDPSTVVSSGAPASASTTSSNLEYSGNTNYGGGYGNTQNNAGGSSSYQPIDTYQEDEPTATPSTGAPSNDAPSAGELETDDPVESTPSEGASSEAADDPSPSGGSAEAAASTAAASEDL